MSKEELAEFEFGIQGLNDHEKVQTLIHLLLDKEQENRKLKRQMAIQNYDQVMDNVMTQQSLSPSQFIYSSPIGVSQKCVPSPCPSKQDYREMLDSENLQKHDLSSLKEDKENYHPSSKTKMEHSRNINLSFTSSGSDLKNNHSTTLKKEEKLKVNAKQILIQLKQKSDHYQQQYLQLKQKYDEYFKKTTTEIKTLQTKVDKLTMEKEQSEIHLDKAIQKLNYIIDHQHQEILQLKSHIQVDSKSSLEEDKHNYHHHCNHASTQTITKEEIDEMTFILVQECEQLIQDKQTLLQQKNDIESELRILIGAVNREKRRNNKIQQL